MIEIIPNWHPILVHFTVGLLATSTVFYLVGYALKKENLLIVARWNLWLGVLITIGTVLLGFYAYNTVAHDGISHLAMMDHRNWAVMTATLYLLLAGWAFLTQRGAKTVSLIFLLIILLASPLLATTAYKGAEVVYRHGVGVMRIPEIHGDGGHGAHSHDHVQQDGGAVSHPIQDVPKSNIKKKTGHSHDDHDHSTHSLTPVE